jgi:hypothetical protein
MITKSNTNLLSVNLFPEFLRTRTGSEHITVLHGNIFKYFTFYLPVPYQRFEVFTAVKIQVEVFWIVTPCRFVVGYQHFRGIRRLRLHPEDGDGTLNTTATLLGVTTQKTVSSIPVIKFKVVISVSVMSIDI